MEIGNVLGRAKGMLLAPKSEWPVVAAESETIRGLYVGYILILAALPAIAGFIKGSVIGYSAFGVTVRTPVGMGIVGMVVGYILGLVVVYIMAFIIDVLAPSFGGQKNQVQALKAAAYAWTASWLAGIATIIPWLGIVIIIIGLLYSIYLLYLGLPHTMQCPPDKAAGYTAVAVIVSIVLSWIVSLIVGLIVGAAALGSVASMGSVPGGNGNGELVTLVGNHVPGRLAAVGQDLQQANPPTEIRVRIR